MSMVDIAMLLQILFIGLKLSDNIDWSWWRVLSPVWAVVIGFIIYVIIVTIKINNV